MSSAPAPTDFRVSAQERVAWRFAQAVGRLHRLGGGASALTEALETCAARCWSAAMQRGHACVELNALDLAALAVSPAVVSALPALPGADPACGRDAPLVLEGRHLFLQRLWRAERDLARALRALAVADPLASDEPLSAQIGAAFGAADPLDAQQRAVRVALTRRLAVISGGPGTGKTTTLARLISVYVGLVPGARVAIAAPTGKAAIRVSEALHAHLDVLTPHESLARSVPQNATTLHRLLGIRGPGSGPSFDAQRPLPFDLIVVDEASMIDLEMASLLLRAVGGHTRLVLCGDRDQLASVEAGAVFAALCGARDAQLLASMATLTRNYRQSDAPQIVAWGEAARSGALSSRQFPDGAPAVRVHPIGAGGSEDRTALTAAALTGYASALEAIEAGEVGEAAASELLRRFATFRILCALRRGPLGAEALNRLVDRALRARLGVGPEVSWYRGRFVIVTRNTAELDLYNGDTGVCIERDGVLAVAFALAQGLRWVAVAQMPVCDDAFALTVHQSQGSEFDAVALVAAPAGHALAARELLYTGITRARRRLEIFAADGALADAASRPSVRAGLLGARLGGAASV